MALLWAIFCWIERIIMWLVSLSNLITQDIEGLKDGLTHHQILLLRKMNQHDQIRKLKQTQCKHRPSFDPFKWLLLKQKGKDGEARPINKVTICWTTSTNNLFSGIIIWRQSSQFTRNGVDKQSSWYFVCYHQVFNDLTGRHLIEKCTLVFFFLSNQLCTHEHI